MKKTLFIFAFLMIICYTSYADCVIKPEIEVGHKLSQFFKNKEDAQSFINQYGGELIIEQTGGYYVWYEIGIAKSYFELDCK